MMASFFSSWLSGQSALSAPHSSSSSSFLSASSLGVNFVELLHFDLSLHILSFLPLSTLASCSSVCAVLFALTQDDRIWRPLCVRRWRCLQNRYELMSEDDWQRLDGAAEDDGDEDDNNAGEESKEGERRRRRRRRRCGSRHAHRLSASSSSSASASTASCSSSSSPSSPRAEGWKPRYIAAEMELCRAYLTLPELMSSRWQFKFLFHQAVFGDGSVSFPRFTETRVQTGFDRAWYDWRWIDTQRGVGGGAGSRDVWQMLAYERRRFISRVAMYSARTRNRPYSGYWLRSSSLFMSDAAPPSPSSSSSSSASTAADASCSLGAASSPLQLSPASALLSPRLPSYRYLPGHPFFTPTPLQALDCQTERRLQVSQFPPLSISRGDDGGWQMLNQYVVMTTLGPDDGDGEEGGERRQLDSDDDEDWMDDDGGDDDEDGEEAEEEDEREQGEDEDAARGGRDGEDDDDAAYVNRTIRGLTYSALYDDEHSAESGRDGDDAG